ncbi:hypothetical protein RRG08_033813 [Elysia crispata]|uniref:Uncharacterized protein n=1 Tax=Elysia crispata TaxID=231223 RepID=A0AAE0XV29_9GAST|nr:hypothetical protein RRG08_033813 [Elysia crispata]
MATGTGLSTCNGELVCSAGFFSNPSDIVFARVSGTLQTLMLNAQSQGLSMTQFYLLVMLEMKNKTRTELRVQLD